MSLEIVLEILTVLVSISGFYLLLKKMPSEVRSTDAATDATKANTAGEYIENQNKLIAAFTAEGLSKVELVNQLGALQVRVVKIEVENTELSAQVGRQSKTIFKLETENTSLSQQVIDYPGSVRSLETTIAQQQETITRQAAQFEKTIAQMSEQIRGLLDAAADNAESSLLRERNLQDALATVPPDAQPVSASPDAVIASSETTVQVAIEGQLIPPKAGEGEKS